MAVWPEERVRELVEAAGGRARVDVQSLLGAFRISLPGEGTDANLRRWLRSVGVEMEHSLRDAANGEVTLFLREGPAANGARPAPAAPALPASPQDTVAAPLSEPEA